jgi:hypothetical protein
MKYFIDTEFIEGFHKPLFGKKRHFIDLISIGIVCEDGREYYAISNEFNTKDADNWVKENVINKLPSNVFNGHNANEVKLYKSNTQISKDIIKFCQPLHPETALPFDESDLEYSVNREVLKAALPEFYAYYADYDWVLFCSLFGRMIDLPKGFPMYCNDIKQMLHEYAERLSIYLPTRYMYGDKDDTPEIKYSHLTSCRAFEELKNENEHDALADARWNKKVYDYLQTRKLG